MLTMNKQKPSQVSCFPELIKFDGLGQAIKSAISFWGERIMLVDLDKGLKISYSEMGYQIGNFAEHFTNHRLTRGDSVATNMENSPDLVTLILSCLTTGIRLSLIEPQVPVSQLERFVELVTPRYIFTADEININISGDIDIILCSKIYDKMTIPATEVTPCTKFEDDAVVIFSSGTTGIPKGVIHTHQNIMTELDSMIRAYDAINMRNHQLVLPLAHASGLYRSLLMPIFTGGKISLRRGFDPETFWSDMIKNDIEFVQLVPSHVVMLNRSKSEPQGSVSLKYIGTASAHLPRKEQLAFEQRFQVPILQGYGLTECTCGITLNSLDTAKRRPGVVGIPLDVNCMKIIDSTGIEVEQGEVGEICVKGPNIATKYLGYDGPDFVEGWLNTHDMGRVEKDGNITLFGRRTNIINRGAYKIYTQEIEEMLMSLPDIQDAAVVGLPHPILGEDLIAFVITKSTSSSFRILGELRSKIASYKIPTRLIYVDAIPKNKMGKVMKDELIKHFHEQQKVSKSYNASEILPRLCFLVADIFGLEPDIVGPDFSRIAHSQWDSLGHVQIITAVEHTFGVKLAEQAVFGVQTIEDLVKLIQYSLDN